MELGRVYLKRSAIEDVYVPWGFCIITRLSKKCPDIVVYLINTFGAEYLGDSSSTMVRIEVFIPVKNESARGSSKFRAMIRVFMNIAYEGLHRSGE